ncbi:MAG: hypothetical protein JST59_12315 [Actinobacteria bacterium]|nr:hypothetical protein [Actinomycetota bacterium]
MSILDDAIREHLELKRAHGADDAELKKLEDEAFGPPQRPDEVDPFAEAPTEFLAAPGEGAADVPEIGDENARSGRRPDIADLQEAPPVEDAPAPADQAPMAPPAPSVEAAPAEIEDELSPTPDAPPPSPTDAADVPLPPPPADAPPADLAPPTGETSTPPAEAASGAFFDQFSGPADDALAPPTDEAPAPSAEASAPADEAPAPPDEEEPSAAEHPVISDAPADADDRPEFVDQPTQMFDVQAHVDAEAAAEAPPAEPDEPQQLNLRGPDAEVAGHPPAEADAEEGSAEFDFFNEQRLSDELDQALEAPLPPTDEHLAMPQYKDAPPEQGGIFDFQSGGESYEEDPSQEVLRRADEAEAAEEPLEDDESPTDYDPETGHEDVLEDTPRFLEDSPDDDDLWFEQKPPKDFDLD